MDKVNFSLIEFVETKTVAVVPTNWINKNEVKWNEKLSPTFAKKGLFPKNKWKSFHVKVITSKTYDSYEKAEKAMFKVLVLNKTDIESDDVISGEEKEISTSSGEDDGYKNPLKIVKLDEKKENMPSNKIELPFDSTTNCKTKGFEDVQIAEKIDLLSDNTAYCAEVPHEEVFVKNYLPMEKETDNMEVPIGNYVVVQENTIVQICTELKEVTETLKRIENRVAQSGKVTARCNCKKIEFAKTRCSEKLPLRDLKDLSDFETEIAADESLMADFQSFLSNQINSKDLRSFVRIAVNKVYSIEIQGKINYTGVKGKKKIKDLLSTEILLKTICEVVPELKLMEDENEKTTKAEAELKYQLQHYFDRKRSMDRKSLNQNLSK